MKKILLVYNPVLGHAAFKNKLDAVIENFQRRARFRSGGTAVASHVMNFSAYRRALIKVFYKLGIFKS